MTPQEAKYRIEHDTDDERFDGDLHGIAFDLNEALQIACEALEKQIPKKPILKSGQSVVHINKGDEPHEWKINRWEEWCCPVCGWFVGERFNRIRNDGSIHPHDQKKCNYCNECGQAIDWESEEL